MEKSNYALKKEQKVELKNEAMMLLKKSGLKKTAYLKMLDKINSGNNNTVKSAINSLKAVENVDKTKKGITLEDIKKTKKINQQLIGIDAFNKNILIKTGNLLTPYKTKTIKQLNYKANGNKMVQVLIKQKMSKEDIRTLGTKLSKNFKDNGIDGSITVAIKSDIAWHSSGSIDNFGDSVKLYDATEYDRADQDAYDEVAFYFIESRLKPDTAGGTDDKNNDCLYNCLKSVLFDRIPWAEPKDLKLFLKINVQSKIDISDIPKIEKALKTFQINVSGDHTYISTVHTMKVINLKLLNGHYTLIKNKQHNKVNKNHVSYTKRKPMIYDKSKFIGFDGEKEIFISKKMRDDIYDWKTDYILVNRCADYSISLKQNYDNFIKDAHELNTLTNGVIDLFKTGNDKTTALNLFDRYTKSIPNAEHINQTEADWISESSTGAITFAREYTGPGYYYDIKSMYPSIMKSTQVYPIKSGEFKIITNEELFKNKTYFAYGIYRCVIMKSNNQLINNLFRFNKKNKYTHIDLSNAIALGLSVQLIEDDKANFLYYARDKCLAGTELFSQYVDTLFKLKESKIKRAKSILNILWGALGEYDKKKIHVGASGKGLSSHLKQDCKVIGIRPYNDNETIIETVNNNIQYKTGFARLKPFIIARGRANIAKIMLPYHRTVMRCHTDGFICSEKPIGIETGTALGELVDDGMKTMIQINSCRKAIILKN